MPETKGGYTLTKEDFERIKARDAQMTPEQRREVSKALVEANTEANTIIIKENDK